jgi:hypothetical protein
MAQGTAPWSSCLGGQGRRHDLVCGRGTWEQLAHSARHIRLHENFLPDLYLRSVRWVSEVLADSPVLV